MPPELSTIVVPIRTSLTPLTTEIEQKVPGVFAGKASERGIDVRYDVARDPIRLQMVGSGLHAATTLKYAIEACRGRFPCVSCGFGEPRSIADVRLQTTLAWDAEWRLRSSTRLLPVNYAKPCEVTWLDIDITGRFVAPVVEQQLRNVAQLIDSQTPRLANVRPQAAQIWNSLQNPVELAPRTWLVFEPTGVAMSPIAGNGSIVTTTLVLQARTRVVVGNRPPATRVPLPPLRMAAANGGGIRVPFDLELPWEEASLLATRDFAGRTWKVGDRPLLVESIQIRPSDRGRVLVEAVIDYQGGPLRNYRGTVFLEGTPRFDSASSSIVIPDLEFSLDANRRGFFRRIAERAAHDSIRERLRATRLPLGPHLAELREEITHALTRSLAPNVALRGQAHSIEPVSVTPLADRMSIRVVATGRAEVEIR